ncbi:hypothetical protein DLJ53_22170 [Acuticoccus sediminis]|uniref:DUF4089 domain-containing protein n=1 Tax=Acuticoccus sediminis TaxID=2184697 RepID=A0A8B2NQG0_9HYPH|nr:DUF4089 domain-containing protein [Acuticoccus sediminis]RAH99251.1 hypothetical protein DLJ53_22170 [Acuticoccus sediminis]
MPDDRTISADNAVADAELDAMAKLVGLDIPAAFRDGVRHQLALNARLVAPLERFTPDADAAPAPVFEP